MSNLQNPYTGWGGALNVSQIVRILQSAQSKPRWWFQFVSRFSLWSLGKWSNLTIWYFSNGLKPPTRNRFSGGWMTIVFCLHRSIPVSQTVEFCHCDRIYLKNCLRGWPSLMTHDFWPFANVIFCSIDFVRSVLEASKNLGKTGGPRVSFWMSCFQEQNKITAIDSILWRRCRRALASCNIPSPLGVWTATKTSWAFDTHAKYFLFGMAFFQAMLNFQGVLLQRNECQLFGNWRESLLVWCKRLCMCNSDIQVAFIEDKQWTCNGLAWFLGFGGGLVVWIHRKIPNHRARLGTHPDLHLRSQMIGPMREVHERCYIWVPFLKPQIRCFLFLRFSFWRWCWVGRWLLSFVDSAIVVCFYFFSLLTPSCDSSKLPMWKKTHKNPPVFCFAFKSHNCIKPHVNHEFSI